MTTTVTGVPDSDKPRATARKTRPRRPAGRREPVVRIPRAEPGAPIPTEADDLADQAAPLDSLLVQATQSPLRRFMPSPSTGKFLAALAKDPASSGRRLTDLAGEYVRIGTGTSAIAPSKRDRRFVDSGWSENPLLRRLVQAYLATGQTAAELAAAADLEWRDSERVGFMVENLVQALSPSNVPLVNPASAKAVVDTAGLNLLRGARNLLGDMARAPRIPAMVDTSGFEVGRNIAATPGAVVLRTEMLEVIQYRPQTEQVRRIPLMIVPPTINKNYALDLLENSVVTPDGSGGNCPAGSGDANCGTSVSVRGYSVTKTSSQTTAMPGDTISYAITVTNTGQADYTATDPAGFTDDLTAVLDDATYNNDADQGATFTAPTLSWSGPLAVGARVTVSYTVTLNDPLGLGDRILDNAVVTPNGSGGDCPAGSNDADCATSVSVHGYTVTKTSSQSTAIPGDTVTYAITVTNTGQADYTATDPAGFTDDLIAVLDDATYNNDADQGATYAAPVLSWSGPLAVGATVTITYTVTVNESDSGDMALDNAVVTPVGTGGNCGIPTAAALNTLHLKSFGLESAAASTGCHPAQVLVKALIVKKSVSAKSAQPGQSLTYAVTVTNTGQADFTGTDPASFTDDLTGVLDDATYNNDATTGATYAEPMLVWSGPLAVGKSVTVTYSVTVDDPDAGDLELVNTLTTPILVNGNCNGSESSDEIYCETTTPVASYRVEKTALALTAHAGDTVGYRITVTNTGHVAYTAQAPTTLVDDLADVLDDAAYNGDATSGAEYLDDALSWAGELAVGDTVTIEYSVTVNDPDSGDGIMRNVIITPNGAIGPKYSGNCPAGTQGAPCVTETSIGIDHVDQVSQNSPTLAYSGANIQFRLLIAGMLIAVGSLMLMANRRRRNMS